MPLRFFSFCFKVYYTNWYCHQQSLPYICSKRGPHPQPLSKGRGESSTELSSQELSLRSFYSHKLINTSPVLNNTSGVREFRSFSPPLNNTSGVQTNASDASNLSTRLLVNSSTKKNNLSTEGTNSSTKKTTCQLKKYL